MIYDHVETGCAFCEAGEPSLHLPEYGQDGGYPPGPLIESCTIYRVIS